MFRVLMIVQQFTKVPVVQLSVYDMEPDGSLKAKPRFQSTITRQNEVLNNLTIIPAVVGTHSNYSCVKCE
jgi:hypothetical protein